MTKTVWKCIKKNCPAMAHTRQNTPDADTIITGFSKKEHCHIADMSKTIKLTAIHEVRRKALAQMQTPPRTLFSDLSTQVSMTL